MSKVWEKLKHICLFLDRWVGSSGIGVVDRLLGIYLFLERATVNRYSSKYRRRKKLAACFASLVALSFFGLLMAAVFSPSSLSLKIPKKFSYGLLSKTPSQRIEKTVIEASMRHGVPKELIWAVIAVESNFDIQAESPVGAIGLMQLMPATAKHLKVEDPWNPRQNIDGGTRYLARLLSRFNGDVSLALAAYNAGPSTVKRYGGIPPYAETKGYVKKVLNRYNKEKQKAIAS